MQQNSWSFLGVNILSLAKPNRHSNAEPLDRTAIRLRSSIFALATAFTCVVSTCVLAAESSWVGFATFSSLSAISGFWHVRTTRTSPVLIVSGTLVRLYRNDIPVGSFDLDGMSIAERNLPAIVMLIALIVAGTVLGALGLSTEIESTLSLSLSSVQRVILTMMGVGATLVAASLAYRDFPRRKLRLRSKSGRICEFYLESREQRRQLLTYLRAIQLEEVMVTVGLTNSVRIAELRSRGPFHTPEDESVL